MKNFIERIKALIVAAIAWLNKWAKDLIQHFTLADNINTLAWIGTAIGVGWIFSVGWVTTIAATITIAFVLLKDCWIDEVADWRDIVAGLLGIAWSLAKIFLLLACWRVIF